MSLLKWAMMVAAMMVVCLPVHADPYAELTARRQPVVDPAYFGTHFHRLVTIQGENKLLTQWPDRLIGSMRLWDTGTRWADILLSVGQWNFERMDAYVEQATLHHAAILYTLGSTPRWASARPEESCPYGMGCAAEPVRMAHWEEYVRRVAQRYRGRISAYELWNEPYFSDIARDRGLPSFYSGSVAQMVEMARIARKVLDEVDPGAVLSTPGFVNGSDRLDLFLASGGKRYVQAVAYHFYSDDSRQFVSQVLDVRAIMKRHGLEYLPLWNTETGLEVYPPEQSLPAGAQGWTHTEAASRMAQFLVLGAAAGLQRFYYYAWDNERSGMFTPAGARLPAWDSYERVQSWLLGAVMHGCAAMPPKGVRCEVELAGKRFLIVWADQASMHTITMPSGQRAISIENLYASASRPIADASHPLKLMLGSDPARILLESTR